jgi:hypothetical protein
MKKTFAPLLALALLTALVPACSTNVQGDDASPVYLSVDIPDQGPKNVNDGTIYTIQTVNVRNIVKVPSNGASNFLDVHLDDYTVTWRRTDGGTVVPAPETWAAGQIITAGGSITLSAYPYMSATALQRPPFDSLFPFNGGLDRETGKPEITMAGIVTFHGHTLSGQPAAGSGTFIGYFIYAPLAARGATK